MAVSLEGDAVGVGLSVGCERVSPLLPPALVLGACASLLDELASLRLP
ncbi:hypothetical protein [Streptomyces sp. PAN_FS17]|nr:hypothetical protein [Streptomyces sp. PAN_FS17]